MGRGQLVRLGARMSYTKLHPADQATAPCGRGRPMYGTAQPPTPASLVPAPAAASRAAAQPLAAALLPAARRCRRAAASGCRSGPALPAAALAPLAAPARQRRLPPPLAVQQVACLCGMRRDGQAEPGVAAASAVGRERRRLCRHPRHCGRPIAGADDLLTLVSCCRGRGGPPAGL